MSHVEITCEARAWRNCPLSMLPELCWSPTRRCATIVQSGADLATPAHERVEPGSIHRAHYGVLYIDEINMLRMEEQQALLTAMRKALPISGRSERSSGALTKTEPVPSDFILVAAGNLDSMERMHPALRSRIRGYGYEVYVNTTMDDTDSNRRRLIRFIAQEVRNEMNKKSGSLFLISIALQSPNSQGISATCWTSWKAHPTPS